MRAGACAVQQTLTSEAASVLKHSLSLARRRGHAQITPLHVAATLLTSRASLLRRACLKSQPHPTSHPLQCRALELCFNVALNRLPTTPGGTTTTTTTTLLHAHHHHQPSLSNALIAALKRAQAHQRRGCIEQQQQQPLLAIKVELEQLIISILDDPSVSRVMREAGFSSTSVKNNLEDHSSSNSPSSVFLQCYTTTGSCSSNSHHPIEALDSTFWQTHFLNCSSDPNPLLFSSTTTSNKKHLLGAFYSSTATADQNKFHEEDLRLVLEVLLRKKRRNNTVVVGDSIRAVEGLVAELMGRVERGEVPDELRSAHFIKFQFSSVTLRFMKKEDVEMKVADLRRKVGSLASGGSGAIIYAGDLKWAVDQEAINEKDHGSLFSGYSPVDHLVTEIGRLLSDYSISSSCKVWLIGTANYQTYMKCQTKQPPLEVQWALQAVSVPSGGLGLSLRASSGFESRMNLLHSSPQMPEAKVSMTKEEPEKLTCCPECTSNYEKDAGFFKSGQQKASSLILSSYNTKDMNKDSTQLPYWLQPHQADSHPKDDLAELRRKWNRLCHSLHHPSPNNQVPTSSSMFKTQSSSCKSYTCAPSYSSRWPTGPQFNQSNGGFSDSNSITFSETTPSKPKCSTNLLVQFGRQQPHSIEFGFGNGTQKHFSELSLDSLKNTENKDLKITLALGNSLFSDSAKSKDQNEREMKQKDLLKLLQENVPWQSQANISSIAEALLDSKTTKKEGSRWVMIKGNDSIGKRGLARAIAESLCESSDHLLLMNMRKDNEANSCSKILMDALEKHEKSVVLIEEIDYADTHFIEFLSNISNKCNIKNQIGGEVSFAQAIFILTTGAYAAETVVQMKLHTEEFSNSRLPNTDHKRKAEWELSNNAKNPRTGDTGDVVSPENGHNKKVFSRQSSSNALDLNIRAEEDNEEDNGDEFKGDPSDLTQETTLDKKNSLGFLESIENIFVFDQNQAMLDQMMESFSSKLKRSFEEGWLLVDEEVLEGIVKGSGSFVASLFEKWLKDVFQTSLQTVIKGGKEVTVRLSLGGKDDASVLEEGFMGSILPKTIQVAFME